MQDEPTSFRIEDPGVRALFTEAARFQAWLDVEAALALAQADLGIIPASAAEEITRKAHLSYIDLEAVHAGLARTGHPLVPLIWELDPVCVMFCVVAPQCTYPPASPSQTRSSSQMSGTSGWRITFS